jgi:twinkle protein
MNTKPLGQSGVKAFEARGISSETASRYGAYTGRWDAEAGELVPAEGGNVVAFPFIDRGAVVAEKYRAPGKKFWQRAGGRRTFWNADALDDPALENGTMPLVITEGEIDALTAIDCGFPLTVSVPDGAPAVPAGEKPEQVSEEKPDADQSGKFEFLWNNRERLKKIKRFVIAVDNDDPGKRLAAELVRRLAASRCMFVTYPEGCKDLNDVLVNRGPEAVAAVLNGAKPYPVRGLYRISDYPALPEIKTYSTGWSTLDDCLRLFTGEFMVVTGIPGHGKSVFIDNLLVNAGELHDWRAAVFSPEVPTVPQHRDRLRKIRLREHHQNVDAEELAKADAWLSDHFVFIDSDPTGDEDEAFDLDWILERATDAVLRDGIRVLVIDPWNEIEHARGRDETMTEYTGRSIRALKRFARLYDVAVIVVVHPTKEVGKDGKSRRPTLYDIADSAHWFNKPDHGVIIDRPDPNVDESVARIAKCRFEETGQRGEVTMKFNRRTSRFELLTHAVPA